MPSYRVVVGLTYPPSRRAEPGDVVDDIPSRSVKWLREQGLIEPVDEPKARRSVKVVDEEAE